MLGLVLIVAPAAAQTKEAFEVIPGDALGFILINNLDQLSNKVENLAKKLKAQESISLLEVIKKGMGVQKGLNEKGTAIIIVLKAEKKEDIGKVFVAIPVTDYGQLAKQLGIKETKEKISEGEITPAPIGILAGVKDTEKKNGQEVKPPKRKVLVAQKGKFALLARPEDRAALEQALEARESIATVLKPAQGWLGEQDIAGVCTDKGVKVGLGLFVANPFLAAGSTTKGQYEKVKAAFAEVEKNVQFIAFGGLIENEGHSRLLTRVYYNPEGSYAKWMAKLKPLEGNLLAQFPAQPYFFAGLSEVASQLNLEGLQEIFPESIGAEKAREMGKEIRRLCEQISQAGLVVYREQAATPKTVIGGLLPMGSIQSPVQPVLLAKVKDASAFVEDASQLIMRIQKDVHKDGKFQGEEKLKKLQIKGQPAVIVPVEMNVQSPYFQARGPGQEKEREKDQTKTCLVLLTALDKQTVLVGELPEGKQAEQWVETFTQKKSGGLAADAQLKKTRTLLPATLHMAFFINVKELADLFVSGSSTGGKLVPTFPNAPPIGFAMRTFDAGIEAQFLLPFETVEGFFEMGRQGKQQEELKKEK